jgi:MoaA/NifB/PqqE/SkfB family radical SAM enzyme
MSGEKKSDQSLLKEWFNISTIASLFSLFIAIAALFFSLRSGDAFNALSVSVLMLIAVYTCIFLSWKGILLIKSLFRVRFYLNWDNVPQRFRVMGTLSDCIKEHGTLEILARTGLRWFIGEEHKLEEKVYKSELDNERKKLQDLIIQAINSGAKIKFFLQNPFIRVPQFTVEQEAKLKKHFEMTVDSYKEIKASPAIKHPDHLSFFVVDKLIDNSMVRLLVQGKINHFIYDLGISFKAIGTQIGLVNKPFIVVLNPKEDMKDFIAEFDHNIVAAVPWEHFDQNKKQAIEEAKKIIGDYRHFSEQRQDKSVNVVNAFVKKSLTQEMDDPLLPPVCVQLLVTNRCSNSCKMCGHHLLYNETGEREMTQQEIECVLEQITKVGVKTVIFSGGEPLCRPDIFELLEFANKSLSVGLLTSGVDANGSPIRENDANLIESSCHWVQVSLDSLNQDTYEKIRGMRTLESTITSIKRLMAVGARIEVSMTLQRDNIEEASTFQTDLVKHLGMTLPIRFKFVHRSDKGNDYLPTERQLNDLIFSLRESNNNNNGYLLEMLDDGFFDRQYLHYGEPVKRKIEAFNRQGFKCHALKLICKIDPFGTVYPCCFLYDDNSSDSTLRNKYNLGSLRDGYSKRVVKSEVRFQNIWNSDRRKVLINQTLPIDEKACYCCTRHSYQNEYLNLIDNLINKNKRLDLKNAILAQTQDHAKDIFWM